MRLLGGPAENRSVKHRPRPMAAVTTVEVLTAPCAPRTAKPATYTRRAHILTLFAWTRKGGAPPNDLRMSCGPRARRSEIDDFPQWPSPASSMRLLGGPAENRFGNHRPRRMAAVPTLEVLSLPWTPRTTVPAMRTRRAHTTKPSVWTQKGRDPPNAPRFCCGAGVNVPKSTGQSEAPPAASAG
jgi:hypothetical protein